MITQDTAKRIAIAYGEIEAGEKLLADVKKAVESRGHEDIRDAFGRTQRGLQLGVPSGENAHRLFNLPFELAGPVIEAHIAQTRVKIAALCELAAAELAGTAPKGELA